MRYNETAEILLPQEIVDEYGGIKQDYSLYKEVKCKVAPYTLKIANNAGAPSIYSYNKLLTKARLDLNLLNNDFYILYNDTLYKKIAVTDYKKCIVIEMEIN